MTFGGCINNIFVIALKMSTFVLIKQYSCEVLLHYFIVKKAAENYHLLVWRGVWGACFIRKKL